ncbi:4-hydroxy-tetrahydrodipicolinate reductase [Actibacterium sp. 188UL27-1]|uniref:4-hydroxy-tetrahydrodipicolinate reductase n=1 Tax=Actibacterium sp. 188UL27-1 TaxID=2786961 RepID=UPI001959B2DA|nr:4-hydroxy-tetrahydrodipicolinate reductase [Actibacterium sp. 188UL27-1]MBM7068514.1 4-hydroxy-tetrahydrodipicolinate reductase [Actibacterium sp. 188UL27-1]
MAEQPGVAVMGASGRMGRMLIQSITEGDKLRLVGAIERAGHDWLGEDVGVAMGGTALGVAVTDDLLDPLTKARIIIDFTAPDVTVATAALAAQARAVHIIGTTGMTEDDLTKVDAAARHAVIVRAGNMSLGVNLLVQLTRKVAAALDDDFDIEVVEAHHRHKVDAPSGTALMLGEAAADGRQIDLRDVYDAARDGITGARSTGHIGFSAIRGGDIIGEHDVIFAGPGERIVLSHRASDRALFAKGALKAASWGLQQEPGHYSMLDVLGL